MSFLLPERVPQKGLAQRPQSKAPHTVVWLGIEIWKRVRMDPCNGRRSSLPSKGNERRAVHRT